MPLRAFTLNTSLLLVQFISEAASRQGEKKNMPAKYVRDEERNKESAGRYGRGERTRNVTRVRIVTIEGEKKRSPLSTDDVKHLSILDLDLNAVVLRKREVSLRRQT